MIFGAVDQDGNIQVPAEKLQFVVGKKYRIILDKEGQVKVLSSILKEIQKKQIFKDIKNPVEWQRNLRKEWDKNKK